MLPKGKYSMKNTATRLTCFDIFQPGSVSTSSIMTETILRSPMQVSQPGHANRSAETTVSAMHSPTTMDSATSRNWPVRPQNLVIKSVVKEPANTLWIRRIALLVECIKCFF